MDRTVSPLLRARWQPSALGGRTLEPVGGAPQTTEPDCTICVPVALLNEPQENVLRTVAAIARAQKFSGQRYAVVLWTNALYRGDERGTVKTRARGRYNELRSALEQFDTPGLEISTALEVLPRRSTTISRIRNNYMNAVLLHGFAHNYRSDHPVMWLDADTTHISRYAIRDLVEGVRSRDAMLVHAVTKLTLDWAEGQAPSELDNLTKAVGVALVSERRHVRQDRHGRQYPEEWGMAFSLATWLDAGGLDPDMKHSESGQLIRGLYERCSGDWRNKTCQPGDSPTPIPVLGFVETARVGSSARWWLGRAQRKGAHMLTVAGHMDYDGGHTSREANTAEPRTITANALRAEFIRRLAAHRRPVSPDPIAERLIQRTLD